MFSTLPLHHGRDELPFCLLEVLGGYVLGFGVLAAVQSLVLLGSGVYFLGVEFEHGIALFFLIELLGALTALGLGYSSLCSPRPSFRRCSSFPSSSRHR